MSDNVIRQDVIQIAFDTNLKVLTEITSQLDDIKKAVNGTGESDGLEKVKKHANNANDSAKKLNTTLGKVGGTLGKVAKKAAGLTFKATALGIGACATAIGTLAGKAVSAYGEFEQLKGGVETLFGAKGAKSAEEYAKYVGKSASEVEGEYKKLLEVESTVIKNANNAYKTAGLSANDYMTTVTSFSASLIQSLGGDTAKAAVLADKAIVDMSDNANKMGTDMGMIQNAYQGFAKQNYTMLDNLKLGYGGTKTEMQRLLKDAQKISGIKYDISSYADVVEAIHVIQENMGITGTTAKEANFTIQGSLNSMKAAWGNLMPALIKGGDEFDQCVDNLIESIVGVENESGKFEGGVINNLLPALEKGLGGIGTLIERLAPTIEEHLPSLIDRLLPPLIRAATSLFIGLAKALPQVVKIVIEELPNIAKLLGEGIRESFGESSFIVKAFDKVEDFCKWIKEHAEGVKTVAIGAGAAIGGIVVAVKGFKAFKAVSSLFSSVGKGSEGVTKGEGPLTKLANMKTTTVLKGLANLAIIVVGLGALAAALIWLAPKIAALGDLKSLLIVVTVMGILGVLGTALAYLAGIIGKVPVATVAKGLANMAIVLVGFGALAAVFCWLAPKIAALGDFNSILKVVAIMAILGTLGAVLSVFAGIVGMIPIPIVLAGLANMALVLGGMAAIIVAFGELTRISGFMEFLDKGGQVLVKIMNILGEMVGALAGGLIEGLSSCLPTLGENLGAFGENIKPLFTSIAGVDMAGVGAFFTALVGLLGVATGNEIVQGIKSFFGGDEESGLAKLGTQLSDFATNAEPFFTKVANFNEAGFTKAKLMFECLAGVSSLPKEGGVKGWFNGELNFTSLASGLASLSNDNVKKFFAFAAELNPDGFDKATGLFDCLANMKSLPKDGGVVGWFMGDVDYSKLADGLGDLASDGVKNFFAMVVDLDDTVFGKTTTLFNTLSEVGNLEVPKTGGFLGMGGESTLAVLGESLASFAENAETFFTQINGFKTENLTALSGALGKLEVDITKLKGTAKADFEAIVETLKTKCDMSTKIIKNTLAAIQSRISSTNLTPSAVTMMNTFLNGIVSRRGAIISAISSITSEIGQKFNSVIKGGNWTLKQFGADTTLKTYKYARGTSGHRGGNAIVNDGRGAELVQMPNGRTFIPRGRNVFMPDAPKGMKVLNAEKTARLFGKSSPTFRYANGTGGIDVFSYENGKELIEAVLKKFVDFSDMSGYAFDASSAGVNAMKGAMAEWADKLIEKFGGGKLVATCRKYLGVPYVWGGTTPSGFDCSGLMQYVYAQCGKEIPRVAASQFAAGMPVENPRQGDLLFFAGAHGTASKPGHVGMYIGNSQMIHAPGTGDVVRTANAFSSDYLGARRYTNGVGFDSVNLPQYSPSGTITDHSRNVNTNEYNSYAPVFNLTLSGAGDEKSMARKVKRWVAESMEECFEEMARKNARAY